MIHQSSAPENGKAFGTVYVGKHGQKVVVKKMDNPKAKALEKIDQVNELMSSSPIIKGLIDGGLSLVPLLRKSNTPRYAR